MNKDLVISGMSGRFPDSDNVDELRDNLFSAKDLITEDDRRWPPGIYGVPSRSGKVRDLTLFDAEFFGFNSHQAQNTDPCVRILLEVVYETIVDGGYNPNLLRGQSVGVYVGSVPAEFIRAVHSDFDAIDSNTTMGSLNNILANRISFFFDFHGPSLVVDTACSSALQALYLAYCDLSLGKIDMAIVAGSHLNLDPAMSIKFKRYNMLSSVGKCQFLDAGADGYVRAETVAALMLERRTTAKRIYGTLLNINSNNDGYKIDGISYPSSKAQINLMKKTLIEANVRPEEVAYIEAHGTGTQAGDRIESNSIDQVYCKGRTEPILVGSIKTNLGHTEASSGMCSLIKVLIAIQNNRIPANLHFREPNPQITGLIEGRIIPNTKNTEYLDQSIIAINSFGMGGTNIHLLIRPEPLSIEPEDMNEGIPRLITFNGRTEESLEFLFDFINKNPTKVSNDFIGLLDEVKAGPPIDAFNYRGYTLFSQQLEPLNNQDIQELSNQKRQVWFVLSGMGCQWKNMIHGLMALPIFSESIQRSAEYLKDFEIDLIDLLTEDKKQMFDSFVGSSVGIAAVQIALIDMLSALEIQWDGLIGHSAGEMMCAYASGVMDAKQVITAKYHFSKCFVDNPIPKGKMAAIGLTWSQTEKMCPTYVYPGCHNSENSVTISGLYSETKEFIEKLKNEKIFVKEVNSCDISFHCPVLSSIKDIVVDKLTPIIPITRRSEKWLSSSVPIELWSKDEALYSSAQYYANNVIQPVFFYQCIKQIPSDAIVVEIAPDSLFRNILRKTIGEGMAYVGLMKRNNSADNVKHLLSSIGELYNLGLSPKIQNLYPKCALPVRRGTQCLSPLLKWDHSDHWFVPLFPKYFNSKGNASKQIEVPFDEFHNNSNESHYKCVPIEQDDTQKMDFITKINNILGIKKSSKVKRDKKLHEWGVDSLMSEEIKAIINDQFNQDISLENLPNLSYGYLLDLKVNNSC